MLERATLEKRMRGFLFRSQQPALDADALPP
jgi:hypothetical protein